MYTIDINASVGYKVKISGGILRDVGAELKQIKSSPCKVAVISDDTVYSIYCATVVESLLSEGYDCRTLAFPSGEESKCFSTLERIVEFLARNKFSRSDILLSLGGGVVSDIVGFAAAIYLRGSDFVACPTTVLAAIDASVGGKTAIDLEYGKNLVGAFHQPRLVLCDTDTFSTLKPQVYSDGIAEAIKCGLISDAELFALLEDGDVKQNIDEIVLRSVKVKKQLVEKDEFDRGDRQLLNLGHTIGHAIEARSGYAQSHGSCVAAGLAHITRAAYKKGWLSEDIRERVCRVLEKHSLPTGCRYSADELVPVIQNDKKVSGDGITLAIPERIGASVLRKVALSDIDEIVRLGYSEGDI